MDYGGKVNPKRRGMMRKMMLQTCGVMENMSQEGSAKEKAT